MGRFNSRERSGGGRDRSRGGFGGGSGGGRRSERPTMYDAVCDNCGDRCKVPFQPTSGKPIYCSDCFETMGNGGDRDRDSRGSSRDFRGGDNEMFSAVCDDCGRDCQVPFRPTGDKPIYCSRCFEKRGNTHDSEDRGSRRDFRSNDRAPRTSGGASDRTMENTMLMLNEKLDKIITLLENKKVVRVARKPKTVVVDEPVVTEESSEVTE